MLGAEQREQLPSLYLSARENRSRFPAWVRVFWIVPLLIALIALTSVFRSLPIMHVGIALMFVVFFYSRRLLLREMLGRKRGRVCPCCWRDSSRPRDRCKGCDPPGGAETHRTYWRLARLHAAAAEQWFGDQYRINDKRAPVTRTFKLLLGILLIIPALILLWVVIRTVYFNDLAWTGAGFGGSLYWLFFLPGGWLSVQFVLRRAGNSKHCAACEYQLAPNCPAPAACPECGSDLSVSGAVVTGRRIGSRWPAAVLVTAFILILAVPFAGLFTGSNLTTTSLVPTDTLVHHVVMQDDPEWHVWRELEGRSLSNQQVESLLDELDRFLEGKTNRPDDDLWDYKAGGIIATEANRGSLSHTNQLRLLELYYVYEYDMPYEMHRWVEAAINQSIFSQAELQAAEMLKPIKQIPTEEFVEQVIAGVRIDWDIQQELGTRSLDDQQLERLLDEMRRRLLAGQDLSYRDDPEGWGSDVAKWVIAEANRREVARPIRLRLLALASGFRDRIPYALQHWIGRARSAGRLNIDEGTPDPENEPPGE